MAEFSTFVAGIGSNTPDRCQQIVNACQRLDELCRGTLQMSSMRESSSYNGIGSPYLNCVVAGTTDMTLEQLTALTKDLEAEAGRTPVSKASGSMPLDIDIVIWQRRVIDADEFRRDYFSAAMSELNQTEA